MTVFVPEHSRGLAVPSPNIFTIDDLRKLTSKIENNYLIREYAYANWLSQQHKSDGISRPEIHLITQWYFDQNIRRRRNW